ncbi:prephenate dehydratase [Salirhabdus sp. Marseille-P4669]|uniref:prephenate dehydratase n=1 Tax=Salirhabdus sp. Marseille-P4669 TaxID=2042310 RepID=UPI000C7A0D7E|nr:prephenate dehydratase [Salirhabdus sp. Marseille-P4669]
MKVGYLGPKGTFTKMAVDAIFPNDEHVGYDTIPASIDAVDKREVDFGVVPIENAIEGSVNLTLDYLIHQVQLPIVSEVAVPIKQHLFVHPTFNGKLTDIEVVYSHRQAIAQCHQFLYQNMPNAKITYTDSTSYAAEFVREVGGNVAAIGNELAAREFGLKTMEKAIHDYENNYTRFVVLHKENEPKTLSHLEDSGYKTTVLITLPRDYAGALHQVLSAFSWRRMNLSKIESRPMKTGLGNYFFIIDVNQAYDDVLFPGVQAELGALGCKMKILGTYPTYVLSEAELEHVVTPEYK